MADGTSQTTEPATSAESSRGATIRTAYVGREVKAYAIFENEVGTLSMWNTLAAVFTSIGAAFLSFAVGIWTNAAFAEKLTPEGTVFLKFVAPLFCLATIISWAIAVYAICSRRQAWKAIKDESKQPPGV